MARQCGRSHALGSYYEVQMLLLSVVKPCFCIQVKGLQLEGMNV